MRAAGKKIVFLCCIFNLMNPFLYAQNEAIPLKIITLPEKEQLSNPLLFNIPPTLEKERLKDILPSTLPESFDKETAKDIGGTKLFFPAYLIPIRQSIAFTQSYKNANEVFLNFIGKNTYKDIFEKTSEKKLLREQWQKFLGIDIWYPYFKAKEIEDWISDKTKVELFHFKGRVRFENNQVKYTFKAQF